ncbi:NTE family protein [Bradyrhizobium sp. Rc3b]|uniref:patatin-like phospholipase family protein n=1 Tax=Bradyrhizobium sp. Rc3b TaxID=1855322 RepID=UPI0008EEC79F|nr:patatin-like phospholipase family protein [Bradyrhizobium sp. Rc3b]SFN38008.1 NTE family protein [Bradyrhizobium sp. Rc3b]
MSSTDIQTSFERHPARGDFLTATKAEDTIGLCLSGGGFRAMIYHVGALVRLNELGLLFRLDQVSSVSGGSITAGMLALAWHRLQFTADGVATNFNEIVAKPLLAFAGHDLDVRAIVLGLLPGRSAADEVARAYDAHLFNGATLQDVTDRPRFTFMATNLQTGSGWRFAKDYAADHRVGQIERPTLSLSRVVAASSAFPPFLSPVRIEFRDGDVKPMSGTDLHRAPFTRTAVLTDGGVYDNMGLERIWRRCRTVLVSNAGRNTPEVGSPTGRWVGQLFRTLELVSQQAENSRKRILFGVNNLGQRKVAYWGIDTSIADDNVSGVPAISAEQTKRVASMRTRLNAFELEEIDLLLMAGYAGAAASLSARGLAVQQQATFDALPLWGSRP